jgi:glycosyltransferase involved in cell wall biosynthesis
MPDTISVPWVLIAGGFHWRGGIDCANAELALYLNRRETPLHLVSYYVDPEIAQKDNVTCHIVKRPYNSFFLGDLRLHRAGVSVARSVIACNPGARVLVNGGNCLWGDLNWVHSVHAAWKCYDRGAPLWFRVKNRITKQIYVRWERRSLRRARIVITNSARTRSEIIEKYGIDSRRVHTVYLGSDRSLAPVEPEARREARERFQLPEDAPVVLFVGALSYDNNKGLDTLLAAWRTLYTGRKWDPYLLIAGGGGAVAWWSDWCSRSGLSDRVRFLGMTDRISECLAASDLLVSPVRYEGYGLNVQEAICSGLAFLVSRSAGIAERIPGYLSEMLLEDPENAALLADRLLAWRRNVEGWKSRVELLRQEFCRYLWSDMAEKMVSLVESSQEGACIRTGDSLCREVVQPN